MDVIPSERGLSDIAVHWGQVRWRPTLSLLSSSANCAGLRMKIKRFELQPSIFRPNWTFRILGHFTHSLSSSTVPILVSRKFVCQSTRSYYKSPSNSHLFDFSNLFFLFLTDACPRHGAHSSTHASRSSPNSNPKSKFPNIQTAHALLFSYDLVQTISPQVCRLETFRTTDLLSSLTFSQIQPSLSTGRQGLRSKPTDGFLPLCLRVAVSHASERLRVSRYCYFITLNR